MTIDGREVFGSCMCSKTGLRKLSYIINQTGCNLLVCSNPSNKNAHKNPFELHSYLPPFQSDA